MELKVSVGSHIKHNPCLYFNEGDVDISAGDGYCVIIPRMDVTRKPMKLLMGYYAMDYICPGMYASI